MEHYDYILLLLMEVLDNYRMMNILKVKMDKFLYQKELIFKLTISRHQIQNYGKTKQI